MKHNVWITKENYKMAMEYSYRFKGVVEYVRRNRKPLNQEMKLIVINKNSDKIEDMITRENEAEKDMTNIINKEKEELKKIEEFRILSQPEVKNINVVVEKEILIEEKKKKPLSFRFEKM
jgi:hypothetical protein